MLFLYFILVKRLHFALKKEEVLTNMNNVAKITLCYIQRDTIESLRWILYYNIFFHFLLFLDWHAVSHLISTVVNNMNRKDTLSEGEQNILWKYFQITGFFVDLSNMMLNHNPTAEHFTKLDVNYKPLEVRGIIETRKSLNLFREY